jgi:hypothetical protein
VSHGYRGCYANIGRYSGKDNVSAISAFLEKKERGIVDVCGFWKEIKVDGLA